MFSFHPFPTLALTVTPDEDGCVWIYGANTNDPWAQNLGPCRKAAEVFSQWLGSVEFDEVETKH
jgi:hypothetical protein